MIVSVKEDLNNIKPNRDVIPSSDCMTFSENAMYVVEYANDVFYETFKSIGINELAIAESGSEVIYEGATLTKLKNHIIGIFEKILAAIKAAYEKVVSFFMSKSKSFKEDIKGLDKEKLLELPDKSYGVIHKFKMENFKSDVIAKANTLKDKISSAYDSINKDDSEAITDLKKKLREEINDALKIDSKDFTEEVITVDKHYVADNFDTLKKRILDENNKKEISDVYKLEKSTIEGIIKSINKTKEGEEALASAKASNFRDLANALHKATSRYNDMLRKQFVETMMVMLRVRKDLKKADAEIKTNEAYDAYVESYNQTNATFIDLCESYIFN